MGNILGNDSGRQPRIFEPYGKEDLKADLLVARARLEKVRGKAQTDEQIRDIQVLESVINDIDPKNMFAVVDVTTFEGPDEIQQLMENLFEELRKIEKELRIMLANQELNTWIKKPVWNSKETRYIERWVNTAVSEPSLKTYEIRLLIRQISNIPTDDIKGLPPDEMRFWTAGLPPNEMRFWIKEILKIPTDKIENTDIRKEIRAEDEENEKSIPGYGLGGFS